MLKLMGVGVAGAILAACGPKATPTPPPEATKAPTAKPVEPTAKPVTKEVVTIRIPFRDYGPNAEGKGGEALPGVIKEWEQSHSGFHIENYIMDYGGLPEQQWTERRLVAADGPDLMWGDWIDLIEKWMQAGLVQFYDDYFVLPNPYVPGNKAWIDQIIIKPMKQSNGKTAYLGLDSTTLWFFTNKKIYAQYKLEKPKMWPDMIEQFKALKKDNIIACAMYHNLAMAAFTSYAVANQILYEVFKEMTGGVEQQPIPKQVAKAVKEGKYSITMPQYQDWLRIASEWWEYAPEGAFSGSEDQGYQIFLSGKAATRYTGCWENVNLSKDMPGAAAPFEYGSFPIPIIPKSMSQFATEKQARLVFPAGYLVYLIPAYNKGDKLEATMDFLRFICKPSNLEKLMNQTQNLVPNVQDAKVKGMEEFTMDPDALFCYFNGWGNAHINVQARDAFVRNWQRLLLKEITQKEYTDTMQPLLEQAAEQELASS